MQEISVHKGHIG